MNAIKNCKEKLMRSWITMKVMKMSRNDNMNK